MPQQVQVPQLQVMVGIVRRVHPQQRQQVMAVLQPLLMQAQAAMAMLRLMPVRVLEGATIRHSLIRIIPRTLRRPMVRLSHLAPMPAPV